jgi:hypothetical protein
MRINKSIFVFAEVKPEIGSEISAQRGHRQAGLLAPHAVCCVCQYLRQQKPSMFMRLLNLLGSYSPQLAAG